MPNNQLWQQYRSVDAGPFQVECKGREDDFDMDISVGMSSQGQTLSFEATIWNLKSSTWSGVNEGDSCRIKLGWLRGGPSPKPVCLGRINKAYTETEGPDTKYVLKGKDKSAETLRYRFSRTWNNATPSSIAKDIASEVGLQIGKVDSVGATIDGYWGAKKTKTARHWLNQLIKKSEDLTGIGWKYYAEAGKLYFLKKKQRRTQVVQVDQFNSINAGKSVGNTNKSSNKQDIDFQAYLHPMIQRDGLVHINVNDINGVYRISDYELTSDTDTGRHFMSGTAVPTGASYRVTFPGVETGYVRAFRQST